MTGIYRKTVKRWCLRHLQYEEDKKCDYVKGFGWDEIRNAQDIALVGDLIALRASVALMKLECRRAGIDEKKLANVRALD